MHITNTMIYLCFFLLSLSNTSLLGQLILKDDFQNKNDHWYWRQDGNQNIPTVHDGILHLELQNTLSTEYCNTEIYDLQEPYAPGTEARIRLKASHIHNGSRGWGFWDGYLDTLSLLFDFDVAWVMQQGSDLSGSEYNWFYFGSNDNHIYQRQTSPLDGRIDETLWNTYKIYWGKDRVKFYSNDSLIFETEKHIPKQNMRMDIWIDNRVLNINSPGENFHTANQNSEMFVDFVEISGTDGPSISRETGKNIIVWDSPNSFPNGEINHLWKEYEFYSADNSETLIFLTGSAEAYGEYDSADELRIVLDNYDFDWDSDLSFNGNNLKGEGKSIIFSNELRNGNHKLDIFSNTTPFLRDVLIVSSENGETVFTENFNVTASEDSALWKTIDFTSTGINDFTFLISGTGKKGEGIRLEIDELDYGWGTENSFDGDILNGTPNTIVINETLGEGSHQIRFYNKGAAQLYSAAAYANPKPTSIDKSKLLNEDIMLRASPNPFNISTIINYRTNTPSQNQISIYNTLGQRVKVLLNEFQQAGEYNLTWEANDITSGIYICILESDNYFKVEKLLLLK